MDNISAYSGRFVVDRIEAGQAVLENSATLDIIILPIAGLPKNTSPGDTLIRQNNCWIFDHAETEARKQRINERFNRIKDRAGKK